MRLDQAAARLPELPSPLRIAQQRHDRVRKVVWIVGRDKVPARFERQSLGADRRRHDRLGHGQRFENLQARAAAGA